MRLPALLWVALLGCAPHRIVLERSCGGICPAYRLELASNGDLVFEGRSLVRTPGIHRGRFDPHRFVELEQELNRMRFTGLRLRPECRYLMTDGPATTVTWVRGSDVTTVIDQGCGGMIDGVSLWRLQGAIRRGGRREGVDRSQATAGA